MEEFRRKTISGFIVYVMNDTADPHKKTMTVTYPNGYMAKWPYEIRDFHMMPWGYVAEMDNGLDIHIENDEDVWSYLQGAQRIRENGRLGFWKDGQMVFPAVADQLEYVEDGSGVIIKRDRWYALLRASGNSVLSSSYDPENEFFYEDGLMGWNRDGKTIIPARYDSVEKWDGIDVFRLEKDGVVSYVDSGMRPLFADIPPMEDSSCEEPLPYPSDDEDNVFVVTEFAFPEDSGDNIVLSDDGKRMLVTRLTREQIHRCLIGGEGDLTLSEKDLELFDSDFSYEFSVYQARTRSTEPVEDLLRQFDELGAHYNSWHYLVGIRVPRGYVMPAGQIRFLRRYFESLPSRTLSLKVSVIEDDSLPAGEVTALMVTHYHERCWPAPFEFDWTDSFNECTLEEIIEKEKDLIRTIREEVLQQYQEEVYKDQFISPFYNVRYCSRRRWRDSRKVLDWFRERNPECVDNIHSFIESIIFPQYSRIGSMEYALRVLRWALDGGGDPNRICDGKTPLDRIDEVLNNGWDEESGDGIAHFERKIGIVRKTRNLLVKHGAKALSELRAAEDDPTDLRTEEQRLIEYCRKD